MVDLDNSAEARTGWSAALMGVKWQPNRDTLAALTSYAAVVAALYVAFQVLTTANVAGNFIVSAS